MRLRVISCVTLRHHVCALLRSLRNLRHKVARNSAPVSAPRPLLFPVAVHRRRTEEQHRENYWKVSRTFEVDFFSDFTLRILRQIFHTKIQPLEECLNFVASLSNLTWTTWVQILSRIVREDPGRIKLQAMILLQVVRHNDSDLLQLWHARSAAESSTRNSNDATKLQLVSSRKKLTVIRKNHAMDKAQLRVLYQPIINDAVHRASFLVWRKQLTPVSENF